MNDTSFPDLLQAADYWFWIPLLMPHLGGLLGAVTYTAMVSAHHPQD